MEVVYRMENDDGNGPYRGEINIFEWTDESHCLDTGRPEPTYDPGLRDKWVRLSKSVRDEYRFGFLSLRQARTWFTPEEENTLEEMGFRITRKEVQEIVASSDYQCVFIA